MATSETVIDKMIDKVWKAASEGEGARDNRADSGTKWGYKPEEPQPEAAPGPFDW